MYRNLKPLILYTLIVMICLAFLSPLIWMLLTSLKPTKEIYSHPLTIFPRRLTLENYGYVLFRLAGFKRYVLNSLVVTFSSTLLILLLASLGGYALARKKFLGKNLFFIFVVLALSIPWNVYLIPVYIMEDALGLRNSWLGLILPYTALRLPWGLVILRGAFAGIPSELEDAAKLDGCSDFQIWRKVMLPLTKPGLATAFIVTFVFQWKEFLYAVTLMTDSKWQTLPVGIVFLKDELQTLAYDVLSPTIIVAVMPIIVLFIFLRNFFLEGIKGGGGFAKF